MRNAFSNSASRLNILFTEQSSNPIIVDKMPSPGKDGVTREAQLQREAAEWNPPTKVDEIPLAAEEDIPVIDVGRYLEAYNVKASLYKITL